jgi:SnoaL-like domain
MESARLELLESRAQIADLIHRYATYIVAGTFQECRALFAPDASFETRQARPADPASVRTLNKAEGIDAILAYVVRGAGSVCPMIHNLIIDVSADRAVSSCMMAATVWKTGQVIIGQYHDTFRRDAEWRFASRAYTMFRD